MADPRVLPAYVSDPEDHVTGSYGHSLSASADLRTQEIQGTLAMGSPLTDSDGSTSLLIVARPVKDLEDELGKPTPNCIYRTTVEEVPGEDAATVPYARKLNQEQNSSCCQGSSIYN